MMLMMDLHLLIVIKGISLKPFQPFLFITPARKES
jgi:hypothetical protein